MIFRVEKRLDRLEGLHSKILLILIGGMSINALGIIGVFIKIATK